MKLRSEVKAEKAALYDGKKQPHEDGMRENQELSPLCRKVKRSVRRNQNRQLADMQKHKDWDAYNPDGREKVKAAARSTLFRSKKDRYAAPTFSPVGTLAA